LADGVVVDIERIGGTDSKFIILSVYHYSRSRSSKKFVFRQSKKFDFRQSKKFDLRPSVDKRWDRRYN
jgi:hypothetical protein